MDYDLLLRCLPEIKPNNYLDYDISYMLIGGISDQGRAAIKDYRDSQINNKIWPIPIAYMLFYWAIIKNFIKKLINYKPTGFYNCI